MRYPLYVNILVIMDAYIYIAPDWYKILHVDNFKFFFFFNLYQGKVIIQFFYFGQKYIATLIGSS